MKILHYGAEVMNNFPTNGDGWFESNLGYSASNLVKRLKNARRHNKDDKDFIDKAISDIRSLKAMEMDASLKMHDWCTNSTPSTASPSTLMSKMKRGSPM